MSGKKQQAIEALSNQDLSLAIYGLTEVITSMNDSMERMTQVIQQMEQRQEKRDAQLREISDLLVSVEAELQDRNVEEIKEVLGRTLRTLKHKSWFVDREEEL